MKRFALLSYFVLQLSVLVVPAQDHPFYMYGEIWDMDTRYILVNSSVKATNINDTAIVIWGRVDDKGRFDLELPFDHSFKVEFNAPGYISKHALVDLNGVAPNRRQGDHGMNVQAALIKPLADVDYSPFAEHAFGSCQLNSKGRSFEWDKEYSARSQAEFQPTLDQHNERRKALED